MTTTPLRPPGGSVNRQDHPHRPPDLGARPNPSQRAVAKACKAGEWLTVEQIAHRLLDAGHLVDLDPAEGPSLLTHQGTESRRIAALLRKMKSNGWARNRPTDTGAQEWTITPTGATI